MVHETRKALATGVIDGAITDVAAAVSRKYYEVQDHFTVVPVLSAYLHGYVNPAWYDSLSDKAKAALDEAGKKASLWAIEASDEAGARSKHRAPARPPSPASTSPRPA